MGGIHDPGGPNWVEHECGDDCIFEQVFNELRRQQGFAPLSPEEAAAAYNDAPAVQLPPERVAAIVRAAAGDTGPESQTECPHFLPRADCVSCDPQPHLVLKCEPCQANTWHALVGQPSGGPYGRQWSCRRCSTVRGGFKADGTDIGISP